MIPFPFPQRAFFISACTFCNLCQHGTNTSHSALIHFMCVLTMRLPQGAKLFSRYFPHYVIVCSFLPLAKPRSPWLAHPATLPRSCAARVSTTSERLCDAQRQHGIHLVLDGRLGRVELKSKLRLDLAVVELGAHVHGMAAEGSKRDLCVGRGGRNEAQHKVRDSRRDGGDRLNEGPRAPTAQRSAVLKHAVPPLAAECAFRPRA